MGACESAVVSEIFTMRFTIMVVLTGVILGLFWGYKARATKYGLVSDYIVFAVFGASLVTGLAVIGSLPVVALRTLLRCMS